MKANLSLKDLTKGAIKGPIAALMLAATGCGTAGCEKNEKLASSREVARAGLKAPVEQTLDLNELYTSHLSKFDNSEASEILDNVLLCISDSKFIEFYNKLDSSSVLAKDSPVAEKVKALLRKANSAPELKRSFAEMDAINMSNQDFYKEIKYLVENLKAGAEVLTSDTESNLIPSQTKKL